MLTSKREKLKAVAGILVWSAVITTIVIYGLVENGLGYIGPEVLAIAIFGGVVPMAMLGLILYVMSLAKED